MGQPARAHRATLADFWDFQGSPGTRYELADGEILAMNQPTLRHAELQMALGHELLRALSGRCRVLGPVGVHCEATEEAFGPDVVVLCEPPKYDAILGRALTNPSAVFEILSPSTSQVDAHDKLPGYKSLASLREYVLVSQKKRLVHVHRRTTAGWILEEISSGSFHVCDVDLSLDAIYGSGDAS